MTPARASGRTPRITAVAQAMVGGEVDAERAERPEVVEPAHRLTVREGEEDDVGRTEIGVADEAKVGALAQVRVRAPDELACLRFRPGLNLRDFRVVEQEPQELAAGVPGGPHDRDAHA